MIDKILKNLLEHKILILDGAMGTMIQKHSLTENDFRGNEFRNINKLVKGNNDLLNITQPNLIRDIHKKYLEAGADIIETNTFNSTKVSQSDYKLEDSAYDLNFTGAKIAREVTDKFMIDNPKEKKFVAGILGPTSRTCSMSPDVNDPGFRNINFDELKSDYYSCIDALIQGGVDIIFVETIFDTLNAKAALIAIKEYEKKNKKKIPLMISVTITDLSGRTLSGQTLEAFYYSVIFSKPISIGLNCALGPKELEQYVAELSRICTVYTSVHSNAGLPNAFGEYDETPKKMANFAENWANNSYINIIGGCCGTTPTHIKAIKDAVEKIKPRKKVISKEKFRLTGLETFEI